MEISRRSALGAHMDENCDELIGLLGARIAMIMEDAVDIALTVVLVAPQQRKGKIETIVKAINELTKLAGALDALQE